MLVSRFAVLGVSALVCLATAGPAKTLVMTGRVLDAITGRPVPYAKVSDDSGAFTYSDGLGNYRLSIRQHARFVKAEEEGMYPAWVRVPYIFENRTTRDFDMFSWSSPAVEGRVIHGPSQTPQPGAEVRVVRTEYFTLTDTLGRYVLPVPSPGAYFLEASFSGPSGSEMESRPESVSVSVDGHSTIDLSLTVSIITFSCPWPLPRITEPRWHPDGSRFYLDARYIDRHGGLDKAIGNVPGVLIR
jgi:hypothetical protein